ncbi:MAG: DUF58 domain-containing protein [Candidatus Omnitrophota bacterium]|jgi:uncharacterized protein (DUF58 family)
MLKGYLKKWLFLALLLCASFVIFLRSEVEFFSFFFWAIAVIIGLSAAWMFIGYHASGLVFTRRIPLKIYEDDTLPVELQLKSKGMFPIFNLVVEDYLPCASPGEENKRLLIEYLPPGKQINCAFKVICRQRGRYTLGPVKAYFFDPLGLFFVRRIFRVHSDLYVYPRYFNIGKFPPLTKGVLPWFGVITGRRGGGEDEFFGTREYKKGDPIKLIHWFSSARKNTLIVKEFQNQNFCRATIIFNLSQADNFGEGKESVVEYMVKIAASVAKYLLEHDVTVEIIAHAEEMVHIPSNKGVEHLEDIFKFLAVAQAQSRVTLEEVFEDFIRFIPNDSNLIIIMPDRDWEYLQGMLMLSQRSVALIPLILILSSFLGVGEKERIEKSVAMCLSEQLNLCPLLFSRGDNLEEVFLR